MPDLLRAGIALYRMAELLDAVELQSPADRGGVGRYERATNGYQDALLAAYRTWLKGLQKQLTCDAAKDAELISAEIPALRRELQAVAQAQLPEALSQLHSDYTPSAEAWIRVADAITQADSDIDTRLVPDIAEKLQRALNEGADLGSVAQSLEPRVAQYAGAYWVLIMRAVGDYAMQASQDNVIYPVQWIRNHDTASCESCIQFEAEYPSYDAMLASTGQSVPGYFAGSPYQSCWGNCRCHLKIKIDGEWRRV